MSEELKRGEAEGSYLEWWTSIETDVRKSMLVWAHRDTARLHALVKMAFEAGQAASATPPAPVEGQALPPLPDPYGTVCPGNYWTDRRNIPSAARPIAAIYTADQMQAYARQAIEADRRARGSIDGQLTGEASSVKQAAQLAQAQQVERLEPVHQVFYGLEGWTDISESEISSHEADGFPVRTLYKKVAP